MPTRIRILLLALITVFALPAWSFADEPDPDTLLDKLPAPPKSYAEAQKRCADPRNQGTYAGDPQSQAMSDQLGQEMKSSEDKLNQDAKAHISQLQATALDPRQSAMVAQLLQQQMGKPQPPNPDQLADQWLAPPAKTAEDGIQASVKQESDGAKGWQSKYEDCGHLPFGASACEKVVVSKANADSDNYIQQRPAVVDKYYLDLGTAWPQYLDGVHKYVDGIAMMLPQGVDPNNYQVLIMMRANQGQRLKAVQAAIAQGNTAFCPEFLNDVGKRYGGVCEGEGC